MKKVFIFAAMFIMTATASNAAANPVINHAVKNPVSVLATPPAAVTSAFRAMFGNVPVRQWKLRSNAQWRAHFTRNGRAWEATFTSSGVLVKSEPA